MDGCVSFLMIGADLYAFFKMLSLVSTVTVVESSLIILSSKGSS